MTPSPRSTPQPPATRLDVIVARNARRAVVFRRGPSREVLLSTWDLARDVLVHGQWLRGRIYTQRADLSPSGEYLVYFAAKHRGRVDDRNRRAVLFVANVPDELHRRGVGVL